MTFLSNEEISRLPEPQKQELRRINGTLDEKDFDSICEIYINYFVRHKINEREFSDSIGIYTQKIKQLIKLDRLSYKFIV